MSDVCIPREVWKRRVRETHHALPVRAMGIPYTIVPEPAHSPDNADHIWINMEVPPCGSLRVSVNILSRLNRDAGYDPRVRLGIIPGTYDPEHKPEPFLREHPPLDYMSIEAAENVSYEYYERDALEALLIERGHSAVRVEVWGELYIREHLGIHQIHSRRASCAVEQDFTSRDGGLKMYYRDGTTEMMLFKFCGQ